MRIPGKRSKYGNKTIVDPVDGIFHSQAEYKRWKELQLLEGAGEIKFLKRQVRYPLVVNDVHITDYVSDFDYYETDPVKSLIAPWFYPVVEDSKGILTPEFKIKRKLMKACHGIDIRITGKRK